jgi:uncharacterized metal-binding protein YceD (DUF177 family)
MAPRQDIDLDPAAEPLLSWRMACADADRAVPKAGHAQTFVATAEERRRVAEALELTACGALSATLTARARPGGRYSVTGRIRASIQQSCVVTLDPIETRLDEVFTGEFCPAADLALPLAVEAHFDPDEDDEPMAIEDGQLAVGHLAYEHLALAIDPFPRLPEADAVAIEQGPGGAPLPGIQSPDLKPNPFAVLAKLKPGKDE